MDHISGNYSVLKKESFLTMGKIVVYDKNFENTPWEQITRSKQIQIDSFTNKKDLIQHISKTDPAIIIINVDHERCLEDFLGFLRFYIPLQLDLLLVSSDKNKIEKVAKQKEYKILTLNPTEIIAAIEPVMRNAYINKSLKNFNGLSFGGEIIIGKSEKMRELFSSILKNADSDRNCLIEGESGTGKSLIAKALHYFHPERNRLNFNSKDMRTIPSTLFESEMFGYEKGAFTGAIKKKEGWFGNTRGTLFLDEIGNCALEEQAKLLTVIQERKFARVGSATMEDLQARLIFGTNENLREAVTQKRFREDLFYRVQTLQVIAPPLRDRAADIPLLIDRYLHHWNAVNNKSREISGQVKEMLQAYHWPGNVRELSGAVEKILQNSEAQVIKPRDLNMEIIKKSEWYPIKFDPNSHPEMPPVNDTENERKTLTLHVEFFEEIEKSGAQFKDVAREIGVSKSTISIWQKGVFIDKGGKTRAIPKKYFPIIRKLINQMRKVRLGKSSAQKHSHPFPVYTEIQDSVQSLHRD